MRLPHFDVRWFGSEIRARRRALGYSTRQMARAAGVSQPYVVALESSKSSRDPSGPCPTVDVLVNFASALQLHPSELLRWSLRQAGPHVLLVTDDEGSDVVGIVGSHVEKVDVWVSAGTDTSYEGRGPHIDLHTTGQEPYQLDKIGATLRSGLSEFSSEVKDRRVGLVFSESDSVLLGSTDEVLEAEHHWQAMVSRSVWAANAEPSAIVCVYNLDVVRRMHDPLAASLDLIQSHDLIWTAKGHRLSRGRAAAMRLLQGVRPPGTRADDWRHTCAQHLDDLTAA